MARHYALASELDLPLSVFDLLTEDLLTVPNYRARSEGRSTRLSKLWEAQLRACYEQSKQENRWGKQRVKRLREGEDIEGTPEKKVADRVAIRSAIRILDRMRELEAGDMLYPVDIIKSAFTVVSRLSYGLSNKNKQKYRATLLWPELEFLAAIFSEELPSRYIFPMGTTSLKSNGITMSFRNHHVVTEHLLVRAVPKWIEQGDLEVLRNRFVQMLSEYDRWGETSIPMRDPQIPKSMLNLHAFIRNSYDLFSLNKILELTQLAARLNIEDPDDRRRLLTIVKKVGDTAKYEMMGANLGRMIKANIPEMPWESLQKLRNLFKEGPQKRPEVRLRMEQLIRQGNIGGLSLVELRGDIVELGVSLKSILSGLMLLDETESLLERIVEQHRSYLEASPDKNRRLSWLPEDIHNLARLLIKARDQAKETCLPQKQKILVEKREKLQNVDSHKSMPQTKKDEVSRTIGRDIDAIEQEIAPIRARIHEEFRNMLSRIKGRNALRETDESLHESDFDTVFAHLDNNDAEDFVHTYLSGSHYRSFETLSLWLDQGPTERPPRDNIQQAVYLRLAMDSWNRLMNFLFPDPQQRQRILNATRINPRYLTKVNEDSHYLQTCLKKYLESLGYKVGLDTELIDFIIYSGNAGMMQSVQIRNMLEHIDVMHEIHRQESAIQVFNELIIMITEVDSNLAQRKQDIESNGCVVPTTAVANAPFLTVPTLFDSIVEKFTGFRAIRYDWLHRHISVSRHLGIPGDGDCMFNAVLRGLNIPVERMDALTARRWVVEELRGNLHLYFTEIADQIAQNIRDNEVDGYPEGLAIQMTNLWQNRQAALQTGLGIEDMERRILDFAEREVPTYIAAMEQRRQMWGGPIELGILARLLDVRIVVYNPGGVQGHIINPNGTQGQADLRYTGNHYDLFRMPPLVSTASVAAHASASLLR